MIHASWLRSLSVHSGSTRTPRTSACAASSITTLHNRKRAVISLYLRRKPWRVPGHRQTSVVRLRPPPSDTDALCASTRHACDQLFLDRPHSQWRLCEIFLRRYSRVTSAHSGRGFTLFGACLAAKAYRGARKGRSSQPLLELLHLHRLVFEDSRVPAFEPLSPGGADPSAASRKTSSYRPTSGPHLLPAFSTREDTPSHGGGTSTPYNELRGLLLWPLGSTSTPRWLPNVPVLLMYQSRSDKPKDASRMV